MTNPKIENSEVPPTREEMREAFENPDGAAWDAYFPVPPVSAGAWTTDDWIKTVRIWRKKQTSDVENTTP